VAASHHHSGNEPPVFEVDGLEYDYTGGLAALRGLTFTVREGERIAVLGANASGKSTLLHLLDGLYFPLAGEIRAFGTLLTERSVETPPFSVEFRRQVGFLFQNSDAQLFSATVEEELAFGPLQLRLPPEEIVQRVRETLALFEIEHLRDRSPQGLSGGEKKRVALAALFTAGPRVLLLDEPSAGLDPRTQQWLVEFLDLLHCSGVTLIVTSHDLGFVRETTERALVISEEHRLVYDGPVAEALADIDLLLSANLIRAHAHREEPDAPITLHVHPLLHEHEE
jgi:cobalt/nickel transport system ATP-binding protein